MRKEIKRICNKCGAEQQPNKNKSNKKWTYYGNEKCKCGGSFEFILTSQCSKRKSPKTKTTKKCQNKYENKKS